METTITKEAIESKIRALEDEKTALEKSHADLVRVNQSQQQTFQQQTLMNQNRFQQISGAIAQLKELLAPSTEQGNTQ